MRTPTPEEIEQACEPKSDQLNADTLLGGPIIVRITSFALTGKDTQPWAVGIDKYPTRPFKPCKTMRRILKASFGKKGELWVGELLKLFRDPTVTYGGKPSPGVRISGVSKLPTNDQGVIINPFPITISNREKSEILLELLTDESTAPATEAIPFEDEEFLATARVELAAASEEVLKGYGERLKKKSKPVQDALRPIYKQRVKELKE